MSGELERPGEKDLGIDTKSEKIELSEDDYRRIEDIENKAQKLEEDLDAMIENTKPQDQWDELNRFNIVKREKIKNVYNEIRNLRGTLGYNAKDPVRLEKMISLLEKIKNTNEEATIIAKDTSFGLRNWAGVYEKDGPVYKEVKSIYDESKDFVAQILLRSSSII